jgi:hypothetical protein
VPALDGPHAWANFFFKGQTIPLFLDNSSSILTDDTLLVSPHILAIMVVGKLGGFFSLKDLIFNQCHIQKYIEDTLDI